MLIRNFILLMFSINLIPSLGFSSEFDSAIDPCSGKATQDELRKAGNSLLEGQVNFIKVISKENGVTTSSYQLNCPRRLYAMMVLREQRENWETTYRALDVIGWQSTFSNEAAQTLVGFIEATPNHPLKRKAAWAFYFLLDGMPKIEVQDEFFSQEKVIHFYSNVLKSDYTGAVYYMGQFAQKIAGYFLQPPVADGRHCYRQSLSLEKRAHGERLAKIFTPVLVDALFQRLENSAINEIVRNEIFVAIRNFSYSEYLKNNTHLINKLKHYRASQPLNTDIILVDDILAGLSVPCL